ncbi:unnamed protein product [Didymodactylos carnosus]|uniref:EGF-like domain-containing protein n=1 Tax=Didymodactylos carnosus TaxID=1234261 RepID=A0A815GE42_9BILA|nr:unnamed protein product [Didymodactylos carnosus]CAF4196123.1 unnamed protein product [Didymodactylos carnosus]
MHLVSLPDLTGFVFCIGDGFGVEQKCMDGAQYDPVKKECNDGNTNVTRESSPCSSSPCKGGKCINIFAAATYYCMCHNGASTRNCELSYCERSYSMHPCVRGLPFSEMHKVYEGCQTFEDNSALKTVVELIEPPLRDIIDYVRTFELISAAKDYIENCNNANEIFLILSLVLADKILDQVYISKQINSVYIYGTNETSEQRWRKFEPLNFLTAGTKSDQIDYSPVRLGLGQDHTEPWCPHN